MTSQHQQRTDDLTRLADKYNMTAGDRIKLFKIYISAHNPPDGWATVPEEPALEQLHAALQADKRFISASTWTMLKETLAEQYRKMIKASPKPEPRK